VRIAETYRSLQGEGLLAGTPSTFIRTSGCNLRCHWCDTPFTSWQPVGETWSVGAVVDAATRLGLDHVVLTGGEPLLSADLPELVTALRERGGHLTLETAGSVLPTEDWPASVIGPTADLFSISPKLASSTPTEDQTGWRDRHAASRRRDDILLTLMQAGPFQFKFVIDAQADLAEAVDWLANLGIRPGSSAMRRVFFMPQGMEQVGLDRTAAWLAAAARALGGQFGPRHHITWFGHTRGT
jgi:7-carboxy-7-deazaguanine synthase